MRFVRVGTLDAPDRHPPDVHIFTASKQPWVVLPPGALAFEEYYESAAGLARREPGEACGVEGEDRYADFVWLNFDSAGACGFVPLHDFEPA